MCSLIEWPLNLTSEVVPFIMNQENMSSILPYLNRNIPWQIMPKPWLIPCRLLSPGDRQPYYWSVYRIHESLSFMRNDFDQLHNRNAEKIEKGK